MDLPSRSKYFIIELAIDCKRMLRTKMRAAKPQNRTNNEQNCVKTPSQSSHKTIIVRVCSVFGVRCAEPKMIIYFIEEFI